MLISLFLSILTLKLVKFVNGNISCDIINDIIELFNVSLIISLPSNDIIILTSTMNVPSTVSIVSEIVEIVDGLVVGSSVGTFVGIKI